MSKEGPTETTNIRVHRSTHTRLDELKPYNTLSFDEFLNELADAWVANRDVHDPIGDEMTDRTAINCDEKEGRDLTK